MVVGVVGVEDCCLGYRAIACPCLCQWVESSSCVFTAIGCGDGVCRVWGFHRCFRSVELVGRSWRLLMIFERVVDARVGRSRCRDGQ